MDIGAKTINALFIFLKWVQISQAEVKNFFESACGEVRPEHNWFMLYMLELIYVRRVDWVCHSIYRLRAWGFWGTMCIPLELLLWNLQW